MAEFVLPSMPALSYPPIQGDGLSIAYRQGGSIVQVLAHARQMDIGRIRQALDGLACSVRPLGPDQWLLVFDHEAGEEERRGLAALLPDAHLVDQSAGRVRIRVAGVNAARVLAKGAAVDFDEREFPVGSATPCLVGHIPAHVTRIEKDSFELIVLRSFAQSLWRDLEGMSTEYL